MRDTEIVYGVNGDWQNHPSAWPTLLRDGWYRERRNAEVAAIEAARDLVRSCQGCGTYFWRTPTTVEVQLNCGLYAHYVVHPFEREAGRHPYAEDR